MNAHKQILNFLQAENTSISDSSSDGSVEDVISLIKSFDDMNLKENLLRGIYACGFVKPSEIQQRAIVPIINGQDIIAQAQSGTGKTATFGIAALQRINENEFKTQALIVVPTRELAQQIQKVVMTLGDFLGVTVHACIGGTKRRDEIDYLMNSRPQIVVGTPGRIKDMISRNAIDVSHLKMFVLDEADEMLSIGFMEQIKDVFALLISPNPQCILLSATMSKDILKITKIFMKNPKHILVKKEEVTLEGVQQFYVMLDSQNQKLDTLMNLYESLNISQAVIFVNTRRGVDELFTKMNAQQFTVSCMHSDMDQKQREVVMKEFRSGSSRVLITTDLLSRGIDVQQVSLIINYDVPIFHENYIHRIGRSGRFGRKGCAITFATIDDYDQLQKIEQFFHTKIYILPNNIAKLME